MSLKRGEQKGKSNRNCAFCSFPPIAWVCVREEQARFPNTVLDSRDGFFCPPVSCDFLSSFLREVRSFCILLHVFPVLREGKMHTETDGRHLFRKNAFPSYQEKDSDLGVRCSR